MKRVCLALVALALVAAAAVGAEVKVPAEVKVKAGRLAQIEATTDGTEIQALNVYADTCDLFREYDPDPKRYVFRFRAESGGTYRLAFITADDKGKLSRPAYCDVVVEGGVPPTPVPPPDPTPPPTPPTPPAKAWLVVIEETGEAVAERGKFLRDADLRAYLTAKGWKSRIADKDVKNADGKTPADLLPYVEKAKSQKLPWVFVVDQDGRVRHEGAMPATPAELLAVLKKIGG